MKLEKTRVNMNIFEKKALSLKDFKEKLIEYKKINDKFVFWEYIQVNDTLKDHYSNYLMAFLVGLLPSIVTLLTLMPYIGIYSFLVILVGNLGVTFFLRSIHVGLFKSRYKKWQILRKEIKNLLSDNQNIFSLLMETEINLQNLKKSILLNEELDNKITQSIERLIENMKEDFANCQDNPDNVLDLIDKITKIENYQESLLKNLKAYQLNSEYIEYKKAHGLIEEDNEREILENKMVKDFKAIL